MMQYLVIAMLQCLLAALLLRQAKAARSRARAELGRKVTTLLAETRMRDEEAAHLASRLAIMADHLLSGAGDVPGPRHAELTGTPFAASLEAVLDLASETVQQARAQAEQSAHNAVSTAMESLQALASQQQTVIADMQRRFSDPDIFQGLLEIDHANAQVGRRIQAIGLLCGADTMCHRQPATLTDVVRGATSRIRDYRHVRLCPPVETTLIGEVVEPVAVALAELLDNAARHCEPGTPVDVGIQTAPRGSIITIDDSGPGMDDEHLQQAAAVLTGRRSPALCRLGDRPQLGLPVVGLLAARHGFRVHIGARSPHGGVRAMLLLPTELLAGAAEPDPSSLQGAAVSTRHAVGNLARPMGKFIRQTRDGHQAE
ncbi:ATP-binding protein [Kitasatospora sp. NPDC059571]|uniref:ATP-binding protein n=1 Tax=Kitasatospora sp. NPDC059571 TaxID=3346871 RepID=UPI0036A5D7DB